MYTQLCTKLWVALDNLKRDQRGVTAIEYAVLAAIIAVALAAGFGDTSTGFFSTLFETMTGKVSGAMG